MDAESKDATASRQMMALRARKRGGPEVFVYEEAPRPHPGPGEISVAVRAASITFDELTWTETWESEGVDRTPIIPAHEFSGVVAEVGDGVTDVAVGDSVFGIVPFDHDGAAAQYVVVPVEVVALKPASVSDEAAAAAALPGLTAWEALTDAGKLTAGQRILIRGGTGGVGAFATQFAHRMGADVTVTVTSPSGVERAKRLGADHVIVSGQDPDPQDAGAFDLALDAVGGGVPEWMYSSVRREGALIVLQEAPNEELAKQYGVSAAFFLVGTRREKLAELANLIAAGDLEVAIAQTFPLEKGREAYESGSRPKPAPGKTVILVD
ncbi:NADP-dependent oxidoreductase [Leifsonia poae]|uniref:NADP-dependent oxidoreductase n=1 Tax=Leifsonia poae TaxID=110933 RepID=UPI003D666129